MKLIHVHNLGDAIVSKIGFIDVCFVEESDGEKSWQLYPDYNRGDIVLKRKKVVPIDEWLNQTLLEMTDTQIKMSNLFRKLYCNLNKVK